MSNRFISKATVAALMFTAMLAPQANATTPTETRTTEPRTETITTSTLVSVPNHTAEGRLFVDSYNQTGFYTIVKHETNQPNLTIVLGEESLAHVNTNEDTLYIYPTAENWSDYPELNSHWVQQLLEEPEFAHYTNITWVGHGQAADFIAHIITNEPSRVQNAIMVQGGEYISHKLTQASYTQLQNMGITIKNNNAQELKEIAHSYQIRGFQNITTDLKN